MLLREAGMPSEKELMESKFAFTFFNDEMKETRRISGVIYGIDLVKTPSVVLSLRLSTSPLIKMSVEDTHNPIISYTPRALIGSESGWHIYFYRNKLEARLSDRRQTFSGDLVLL